MNKIDAGIPLEYIGPDICAIADTDYKLIDPETGREMPWVCHGHPCILRTAKPVRERFIVRAPNDGKSDKAVAESVNRIPRSLRPS